MDQTPIYFDMRRNTTYHYKGEKSIKLIRTNGHRKRITVCLGIMSDGRKLPPFIIFKGKNPPTNPCKKSCFVASNSNAWITESLMETWVLEIWRKAKVEPNVLKLLIIDHCSSHLKDKIQKLIKEDSFLQYVPPGCTSLGQPLDLRINKIFKDKLKNLYEDWLLKFGLLKSNTTKSGTLKAPSSILVIKWINEAWRSIDTNQIIASFKAAGISVFFLRL